MKNRINEMIRKYEEELEENLNRQETAEGSELTGLMLIETELRKQIEDMKKDLSVLEVKKTKKGFFTKKRVLASLGVIALVVSTSIISTNIAKKSVKPAVAVSEDQLSSSTALLSEENEIEKNDDANKISKDEILKQPLESHERIVTAIVESNMVSKEYVNGLLAEGKSYTEILETCYSIIPGLYVIQNINYNNVTIEGNYYAEAGSNNFSIVDSGITVGCNTCEKAPEPTKKPTATATPVKTPAPTKKPATTPKPIETPKPTPTATPKPTTTPKPTPTATPKPTTTPKPTPTATPDPYEACKAEGRKNAEEDVKKGIVPSDERSQLYTCKTAETFKTEKKMTDAEVKKCEEAYFRAYMDKVAELDEKYKLFFNVWGNQMAEQGSEKTKPSETVKPSEAPKPTATPETNNSSNEIDVNDTSRFTKDEEKGMYYDKTNGQYYDPATDTWGKIVPGKDPEYSIGKPVAALSTTNELQTLKAASELLQRYNANTTAVIYTKTLA